MWDLLIVRQQRAANKYNISAVGWWDGGGLMMLPSREEGGAVADLLIVRRRQQGQWILRQRRVFSAGDRRLRVR